MKWKFWALPDSIILRENQAANLCWNLVPRPISIFCSPAFNCVHMDLNQACLVVDGRPLTAQPWQPDFTQGLYAETYHTLLKSAGMYPNDWNNDLSAQQFVGGTMLFSWDLMPDDSDGTAYCRPGVWVPLLPTTTTTLLAYAQYDKLVVVDAYRTVTFDYNTWCSCGNIRRPSWKSPRRPRHWLVSTPGRTMAASRPVPSCLPNQHGSQWHCWRTLGRCLPGGLFARWILWFLRNLSTNGCEEWATGTCATVRKCYRAHSRGPADSLLFISWPCGAAVCPWGPSPPRSGNMTSLATRPWSDTSWDKTHPHTFTYIQWKWPRVLSRPPVHTRVYSDTAWTFISFHCHGHSAIIMLPAVFGLGIYRQVSNISCTKFQHLKDSRTVLRLSLPNPLKPDVKSRMKM